MQDQLDDLIRDWQTKHKALAELQTKYASGFLMPDYDGREVTPALVQDARAVIQEVIEATEAEQSAGQAVVEFFIDQGRQSYFAHPDPNLDNPVWGDSKEGGRPKV